MVYAVQAVATYLIEIYGALSKVLVGTDVIKPEQMRLAASLFR